MAVDCCAKNGDIHIFVSYMTYGFEWATKEKICYVHISFVFIFVSWFGGLGANNDDNNNDNPTAKQT